MRIEVPLHRQSSEEQAQFRGRGRPSIKGTAMSPNERKQRQRSTERALRDDDVAVLDFETDPFDREAWFDKRERVFPFLAVLVSRHFEPVVIWEETQDAFIDAVLSAINNLPRKFTIYAHNGGKFDYMFFVHKLRGAVMFKGRGIMSCRVGNHELRDSFHIIPERLASYKKDNFDYLTLKKGTRHATRLAIITYCTNDANYCLDIVCSFIQRYGRKLSIGQASSTAVKQSGIDVSKLNEVMDDYLRPYYFGGRVECIAGIGHFISQPDREYKLYDVNSMYSAAMRNMQHPIGGPGDYVIRSGLPGPDTFFIDLTCDNIGALVTRGPDGETSARVEHGRFQTTIHEYNAALELGLIRNCVFHSSVDCIRQGNFKEFVDQWSGQKVQAKERRDALEASGKSNQDDEWLDAHKDYMFAKFFLNNAYGKFAQNPRKFKEAFITPYGERPDYEDGFKCCSINQPWQPGLGRGICMSCGEEHIGYGPRPVYEDQDKDYAIWERPTRRLTFNNVGTAASITGAARAILMRGIASAADPIYCDTDSIICAGLEDVPIHKFDLGAWDIEDKFSEVIICGKKLYACKTDKGKFKYRMKGGEGAEWQDYLDMLANEAHKYISRAKGPTMKRDGSYFHMTRSVRATGPRVGNLPLLNRRRV